MTDPRDEDPTPEASVNELWHRWKDEADPHARERLVLHYSPLVKFVAGRLRARLPTVVEQADLVSDGVLGLMDAVDKFDLGRGLQFQTYAVQRIRGAMVDGLRAADWLPRSTREKVRTHDHAVEGLQAALGRVPTVSEVAEHMHTGVAEVRRVRSDVSRSTPVPLESADESELSLPGADALIDDALPDGFVAAVKTLPERDQVVLALYYWERLTLAEVGRVLGVTESRVSQLHSRAVGQLRRRLTEAVTS